MRLRSQSFWRDLLWGCAQILCILRRLIPCRCAIRFRATDTRNSPLRSSSNASSRSACFSSSVAPGRPPPGRRGNSLTISRMVVLKMRGPSPWTLRMKAVKSWMSWTVRLGSASALLLKSSRFVNLLRTLSLIPNLRKIPTPCWRRPGAKLS